MKKTLYIELSENLGISQAKGMEAVIKAKLISAILKEVNKQKLTHEEIAKRSGLARSSVTGILSGGMQKVTTDRILKLVEAVGLVAEVRVRKAA